ncbi:helix-turn-helix domain-containing protein [Hymenobacter ruber]
MEPQPLTAAQRVARLIEELDITPYEFGKQTGLSHQTISNVLTGKNRPSLDTLEAIADRYPDTAVWLLTGKGEPRTGVNPKMDSAAQLPPAVPSEAKPAPGTLRINREGEDGNYWKQIAAERAETIELLKQLLTPQFPGLADAPGKSVYGEYAAVALSPEVGFQQAGRQVTHMRVAPGHRYAWVDEALAQPLTVEGYLLKKTA